MYFEDSKLGLAVEIAPATIKKDKMIAFAHDYDPNPLHKEQGGRTGAHQRDL